jgi:hypothetical protein
MLVTGPVMEKKDPQTRPARRGQAQPAVLAENPDEFDKLDMSGWEDLEWQQTIERKLKESCIEAMSPDCKWLTHEEVFGPIREKIAKEIAENPQKQGDANLDALDMSGWEDLEWQREIEWKLKESCMEAMSPDCKWLTHEEVFGPIREKIAKQIAAAEGRKTRHVEANGV